MKAVLILCLLAFISCEKDIIDIGKCIYNAPKVKELINDFIVAFVTKDFSKLWPKIQESLPELINIVIGCVTEVKAIAEEQPILRVYDPKEMQCKSACSMFDEGTMNYKTCFSSCMQSNY